MSAFALPFTLAYRIGVLSQEYLDCGALGAMASCSNGNSFSKIIWQQPRRVGQISPFAWRGVILGLTFHVVAFVAYPRERYGICSFSQRDRKVNRTPSLLPPMAQCFLGRISEVTALWSG